MKLPPTPDGKVWYTRLDGSHVRLTLAQRAAVLKNLELEGLKPAPQADDKAPPPYSPEVLAIMEEPVFKELLESKAAEGAEAALFAIRDDEGLQAKLKTLAQAGVFGGEAAGLAESPVGAGAGAQGELGATQEQEQVRVRVRVQARTAPCHRTRR